MIAVDAEINIGLKNHEEALPDLVSENTFPRTKGLIHYGAYSQ
jgi:hypothetical protein